MYVATTSLEVITQIKIPGGLIVEWVKHFFDTLYLLVEASLLLPDQVLSFDILCYHTNSLKTLSSRRFLPSFIGQQLKLSVLSYFSL